MSFSIIQGADPLRLLICRALPDTLVQSGGVQFVLQVATTQEMSTLSEAQTFQALLCNGCAMPKTGVSHNLLCRQATLS